MNIIFMRHGEAVDNVRGVLSCKEIRCSVLTEAGFRQVAKSVSKLPWEIDKIYSSPLIRTLQTAKEIMKVSGAEVLLITELEKLIGANMTESLIIQNLMQCAPGKRQEIFSLGLGNMVIINIAWS